MIRKYLPTELIPSLILTTMKGLFFSLKCRRDHHFFNSTYVSKFLTVTRDQEVSIFGVQ